MGGTVGGRKFFRLRLLLFLLVLLSSSSMYPGRFLILPSAHAATTTTTKVSLNPIGIAGLNYAAGSSITFQVNLTNAPAINSFGVSLQYDQTVLQAKNIDYTGNVLGPSPFVLVECIDDVPLGSSPRCTNADAPGVVTLQLVLVGTNTTAPTNGPLFTVQFTVKQNGFSTIHILSDFVSECQAICGIPVTLLNLDGYFSNIDCPRGSGKLCTPPVPYVTYSPSTILADKPIQFNASRSNATNTGASIRQYVWNWGGGEAPETTTTPNATHVFLVGGERIFTLTINDTYGIRSSYTIVLEVLRFFIQLSISGLTINPEFGVTPGTQVKIVGGVSNLSTRSENVTVHLVLDPGGGSMRVLATSHFLNMTAGGQAQTQTTWDTTGYNPRVYPVELTVDPVRNSTTGEIIQNDLSNIDTVGFVQLIEPQLTSIISLSLGQALGGGILALFVLAGAAGFFRRLLRRKPSDAPLP